VRVGEVKEEMLIGNACSVTVTTPTDGWLSVSLAPVNGWRWRLDGQRVQLEQGPGIIQYLPMEAGDHRLEGRYQPPLHRWTTVFSGCAVLVVIAGLAGKRRQP
jgi:uncharacterized membrane protein YfhO